MILKTLHIHYTFNYTSWILFQVLPRCCCVYNWLRIYTYVRNVLGLHLFLQELSLHSGSSSCLLRLLQGSLSYDYHVYFSAPSTMVPLWKSSSPASWCLLAYQFSLVFIVFWSSQGLQLLVSNCEPLHPKYNFQIRRTGWITANLTQKQQQTVEQLD